MHKKRFSAALGKQTELEGKVQKGLWIWLQMDLKKICLIYRNSLARYYIFFNLEWEVNNESLSLVDIIKGPFLDRPSNLLSFPIVLPGTEVPTIMCCMSSPSPCLGLASKAKATIPEAISSVFFLLLLPRQRLSSNKTLCVQVLFKWVV